MNGNSMFETTQPSSGTVIDQSNCFN